MKSICIVGFTSLVSNPRLVKEADALIKQGYRVTVLAVRNNANTFLRDEALLQDKRWKCIFLDVCKDNPQGYFHWLESGVNKKVASFLSNYSARLVARWMVSIYYRPLLKLAIAQKADLYIGHVSSLSVAVEAAKRNGSKVGYDVEDFHTLENEGNIYYKNYQRCVSCLENTYLSKCDYITSSSPLIAKALKKAYGVDSVIILNVFETRLCSSSKEVYNEDVVVDSDSLNLFWFSQWIGPGRGLETIIQAMSLVKGNITLYLQGDIQPSYKDSLLVLMKKCDLAVESVIFLQPCSPEELVHSASRFDVGLALEQRSPENRNICLTNKIFTYFLAGLSILATSTDAQKALSLQTSSAIWCFDQNDVRSLSDRLTFLQVNKNELQKSKRESLELGLNKYNWDLEKKKLISVIEEVLM